jgi:serine/threonine-protein kinase RsbW
VNGAGTHERERRAIDGVTRLRLASGPALGPVLRRVVSMALARADWPVDRLDDAILVCDALCAHTPAYAREGRVTFSLQTNEREAELRVHDLEAEDADALLRDTMLPVVGNVLEQVADRVTVQTDEDGVSAQVVIVLSSN